MRFRLPLLLAVLLVSGGWAWAADDVLVVRITPQVLERDHSVAWEQPLVQQTRPGAAVVVNIEAESLSIRVLVTPFVRGNDFFLVVQGEVRQVGASSTRGSTTVQSLLVPPGEPIAFFPLGRDPSNEGRQMVVLIRVERPSE